MKVKKILVIVSSIFLVALIVIPLLAADAQYIGSAKCKVCHKSENRGDQWGKWEAGPHAKAFATLASEESKKVAEKAGVTGDPQKAAECLKCHVTAHGAAAEAKAESFDATEGVGCEACHGPGSLYKSMKVMKDLRAGTQDAKAVAFLKGDKKTCVGCHNPESPTYKPFNYEEMWAKIAHNIPK